MHDSPFRLESRRSIARLAFETSHKLSKEELGRSAIVFAPHPDDETLGCGGTILKKKEAGAHVAIVFMTDGGQTQSEKIITSERLTVVRKEEAIAAAEVLGIKESDLYFLEARDGELSKQHDQVRAAVQKVLSELQPEEIYIPYYYDGHRDHLATNAIVRAALSDAQRKHDIFEYPVWFWNQWPWVKFTGRLDRETLTRFAKRIPSALKLLVEFRHSVYIEDVREQKRLALDKHSSQMAGIGNGSEWTTLMDIQNGEFIECFFQKYEIFRLSEQ